METQITETVVAMLPLGVLVVLAFIGSLHLVIPVIQNAVAAIVKLTPSKKDDEKFEEVIASKPYILFVKLVGYIFGLKLSEVVKKKKEEK